MTQPEPLTFASYLEGVVAEVDDGPGYYETGGIVSLRLPDGKRESFFFSFVPGPAAIVTDDDYRRVVEFWQAQLGKKVTLKMKVTVE